MRLSLAIASLVLAGCSHSGGSFDAEYQATRNLLQSEQYDVALTRIDAVLRRAGGPTDARIRRRFRLLKAEALLAERRASDAAAVLAEKPLDSPNSTEDKARALLLQGTAAYFLAHYSEAQELLGHAAELARQAGSAGLSAEVQLRQANLDVSQGHFPDADRRLRDVIRVATDLHETSLEATATGSLGFMLMNASKYDQAIVWFERARGLHIKLGANRSMARDAGNLGFCYHRLGDYDRAQHYYEEARGGFGKTGDLFDEQILTGNTGSLLLDAGNYTAAAAAFRQAYEIAHRVQNDDWAGRWAGSLAVVETQFGDWDSAERHNNEALALERRLHSSMFEAMELCTAGRIAAGRGNVPEAERLFREAMDQTARDPRFKLDAQTDLAKLYFTTGRPGRAAAEFRAAVKSIDRLNAGLVKDDYKFGYLASLIEFYRMYVDFLMANHQPEQALMVAESSRTHVLAQRSGRPVALQSHTPEAYQQLARQAKAILLEYWLGTTESYLWVITPQQIRDYRLAPAKSIRELVESYRNLILGERNPLETGGDTGRKLYDALLAPAGKDLCPACRVIVVPDQDLYTLNFESLPAGSEKGRFWIENASVEIAPSLDYLVDVGPKPHAKAAKAALLMGDPVSSLPEFPKLEYASREISSIEASLGASSAKILEGARARPDSYAQAQPGNFEFIHFAAHASANPQSPLDSAVILSGPPDRCKLFARDVMTVPLNAELVTISACRSAGAKTYAGEGLVGFAWAFLRAGARNVIAGLWDVDDRSTAQLMAGLYAELARGSTPADALRASKLALIHGGGSYAKPYYWAAFQVYTGAAE